MLSLFFVKQKTAYEMRISDWSSDVCSSDLEDFRTLRRVRRTVGEFARQAQFSRAGGILALNFSFRPALQPVFHPVQDKVEQGFATFHIVGKEMIEMVAHCIFDQACGFGTGQAILGMTLKFRIANR